MLFRSEEQGTIFEADIKQLNTYKSNIEKTFIKFQDAYFGTLATVEKAIAEGKITKIVGGVVVPDTLDNQEKYIKDTYNATKVDKLKANDLLYKLISNYELKKSTAQQATNTANRDNTLPNGIIAKPDTLKPDRLPMHASPLQYKHWKSDFLAYFKAINGQGGDIEQQQSFLRACISEDFREDLSFDDLPVSIAVYDDEIYDNPNECQSCLQKLTKYFLQRVPMIIRRFNAMRGSVNMNRPILDQLDRFKAEYNDTQMATMSTQERLILAFMSRIPRQSDLFHEIVKEIHTNTSRQDRIDTSYNEFYKFIQAYDSLNSVTIKNEALFVKNKGFKRNKSFSKPFKSRGRSAFRRFSRSFSRPRSSSSRRRSFSPFRGGGHKRSNSNNGQKHRFLLRLTGTELIKAIKTHKVCNKCGQHKYIQGKRCNKIKRDFKCKICKRNHHPIVCSQRKLRKQSISPNRRRRSTSRGRKRSKSPNRASRISSDNTDFANSVTNDKFFDPIDDSYYFEEQAITSFSSNLTEENFPENFHKDNFVPNSYGKILANYGLIAIITFLFVIKSLITVFLQLGVQGNAPAEKDKPQVALPPCKKGEEEEEEENPHVFFTKTITHCQVGNNATDGNLYTGQTYNTIHFDNGQSRKLKVFAPNRKVPVILKHSEKNVSFKVETTFDTGCTISMINTSIVKKYGLPIDKNHSHKIKNASGQFMPIDGTIDLEIKFGKNKTYATFLVCPTVAETLISAEDLYNMNIKLTLEEEITNNVTTEIVKNLNNKPRKPFDLNSEENKKKMDSLLEEYKDKIGRAHV